MAEPHGSQSLARQPHAGQPHAGQPYAGQPYAGQPFAAQSHALQARSALHGIAAPGRHGNPQGPSGVRVSIVEPLSIALLLPLRGRTDALLARLAAAFGAEFAGAGPRCCVRNAQLALRWAGSDRWLASVPGTVDIERRLAEACGETASVLDQSDARFVLALAGADVPRTLAKGVAIDLHPRTFATGATALVQLAHVNVQLTRLENEVFELCAPRSTAADLWDWLQASAAQYGIEVSPETLDQETGRPR